MVNPQVVVQLVERHTLQPLCPRDTPAFTTGADVRSQANIRGRSLGLDLLPARAGKHVVDADVALGQNFKRVFDFLHVIELRARCPEAFKP